MPYLLRLLLVGLALASPAANAGYQFAPVQTFTTGSWADAAAVGDVNGDGRDDVVVTTTFYFDAANDYKVFIYLQRADGTLAEPLRLPYGSANGTGLAVGNLDRDAAKEIVVGTGSGIMIIDWDQQRGGPVVHSRAHTFDGPFASNATDVVLLDADRDGALDIVAQNAGGGAVIYLGDGEGGVRQKFALATPTDGYNDIDAGDFNGDGFKDFVVLSGQGDTYAYLYLNNGTAAFSAPIVINPNPSGRVTIGALGVGDFNNDGRDDLAIMRDRTQVAIYTQDSSGTLAYDYTLDTGSDPNAILGHDLDLDGLDDLLIQHGSGPIGFHLQGAAGLATERIISGPYATWINTQGMAVGDLNGDGCPDVAVANYNYGLVLYAGEGCRPVADLRIKVELGDTFLATRLDNIGGRDATAVETTFTVSVTAGELFVPAVPCPLDHRDSRSVRFTCALSALEADYGQAMHIPIFATAFDSRSVISVSATTTTLTPEVKLSNNTAKSSRHMALPIRPRPTTKVVSGTL